MERMGAQPGTRMVRVGRQALYDAAGRIVGYELLFRDEADADSASARGAYATSQVIVNAFTEFGLDQLVGGRLGFVNLTREFLVGELPLPLAPEHTVLEILESVPLDDEVIAGVADLAARGYAIALDDFVFNHSTARLLDIATYVKIDMLDTAPQVLAAVVTTCRHYPRLKIIAERVETAAQLALAQRLGFDLYQGYALSRPQIVSTVSLAPSRLRTLRLLALVNDPDADMDDVASLVATDPALSFRLLKAVNSVASGIRHQVASVHQAAVLVGFNRLRKWLTLMALSDVTGGEEDLTSIMVRARFCQRIAEGLGLPTDSAFTMGLLDGAFDLVEQDRGTLVGQLPLTPELARALLEGAGPLGEVLRIARTYEAIEEFLPDRPTVSTVDLTRAYLESIRWAEELAASQPDQ